MCSMHARAVMYRLVVQKTPDKNSHMHTVFNLAHAVRFLDNQTKNFCTVTVDPPLSFCQNLGNANPDK